jgi:hypothetical protein
MSVEFAYAGTRALSRYGDHLTVSQWRLLDSSRGLAQYLHLVRGTALGPRVQHFSTATSPHVIERSLRREWRAEVGNVVRWAPARWRPAIAWTRWLPELPALGYLIGDDPVLPWMLEDPVLTEFASPDPDIRRAAIEQSELAVIAKSGATGVLHAWLQHWRRTWPGDDRERDGTREIVSTVAWFLDGETSSDTKPVPGPQRREQFEAQIVRIMRARHEQPAVVFCHLLLTALELHRLRDGLLRRALRKDTGTEGGS